MAISRSASHQRQKRQRSKRLRRLLILNIIMLLIIGALIAVYFAQRQQRGSHPASSSDVSGAPGIDESLNEGSGVNEVNGGNNEGGADEGSSAEPSGTDKGGSGSALPQGASGDSAGGSVGGNTGDPTDNSTDNSTGDSDKGTVKLSFTGDILLAASVETLMLKYGFEYPYMKVLPFLQQADLTAANLETPVTLRGTPAKNKQYVYKASPDALPALLASGIDLVNLANNHTLDQGEEGLLDTIDFLNKAKLPNVGAGRDDTEAFTPVIKEVNDVRVAYLGLTGVIPSYSWNADKNHPGLAGTYDPTKAVAAIKAAKEQADVVVVMVHWGTELKDMPNAIQTNLGHAYIDAGADLVIGSHPHVLQGIESYKGKWIAYSLGNFIFSGMPDKRTADTGVLDANCDFTGKCSLQFHPMRAVQSQPAPLEGDEATALLNRISGISIHAVIDTNGVIKEKE